MLGIMVESPTIPGSPAGSLVAASEDGSKKIRKPYTITKSRESWSEQEHDKFLEALQLFDRDWKKIEAFVGSKSVIQIRSHAQKYFLKVQKNGSGEHVPPPRPKRKSAQPYPRKAFKLGMLASLQHSSSGIPSSTLPEESGYSMGSQSSVCFGPPETSPEPVSTLMHHRAVPTIITSGLKDTPDFADIYAFIGSTFDPGAIDHLKKLKELPPIDRETIVLLMRNLSINLSSPDFEENRFFSCMYGMNSRKQNPAVTTSLDRQAGLG